MSTDFDIEPRRFICGSCYVEFSSLQELTRHAEECFSSSEQQQQIIPISTASAIPSRTLSPGATSLQLSSTIADTQNHYYDNSLGRRDEPTLAFDPLNVYCDIDGVVPASSDFLTLLHSGSNQSRLISNFRQTNENDFLLASPESQQTRLNNSGSFGPGGLVVADSRNVRIRGKNLSLNGIRVTPGCSAPLGVDIEYRGSAVRKGFPGPVANRPQTKTKEHCAENAGSESTSSRQPGKVRGPSNRIDQQNPEPATLHQNEDDSGDEIGKSTYPDNVSYKPQCTGPRQRWRYLPADARNLRLPNGKVKKSYRIHCPVCHGVIWRQNLHQHMRSHTGQRPHSCDQCEKAFSTSADLKKHLITHQERETRPCYYCPFCPWTGMTNLPRHVKTKHPGLELDPNSVGQMEREDRRASKTAMSNVESVVENVFQRVITGTFHPPDDDLWEMAIDRVEEQLGRDQEFQHKSCPSTRIECNICWRVMQRTSFADHRRIHQRIKPFKCSICDQKFRYRKWLIIHHNQHYDGRPHVCDHCGNSFVSSLQLARHTARVHGKKRGNGNVKNAHSAVASVPWRKRKSQCDVCGRLVSQPKLTSHLREHADGAPIHQCDQCPKKYRSVYFLRLHKARMHEGVEPYKCLKCDFRASRRNAVVTHMEEIHGEIVDGNVILVNGMTTVNHLPTKKCSICQVRVFLDNYTIHLKKHTHPEEYERLRRAREQLFQNLVYEQRANRNPERDRKRGRGGVIQKETPVQMAARRILNTAWNRKMERRKEMRMMMEHDYSKMPRKGRKSKN